MKLLFVAPRLCFRRYRIIKTIRTRTNPLLTCNYCRHLTIRNFCYLGVVGNARKDFYRQYTAYTIYRRNRSPDTTAAPVQATVRCANRRRSLFEFNDAAALITDNYRITIVSPDGRSFIGRYPTVRNEYGRLNGKHRVVPESICRKKITITSRRAPTK